MSDDRFKENNPDKTAKPENWDGKTLEEAMTEAFEKGNQIEIGILIRFLPEDLKAAYREKWKKLRGEK